MIALSEERKKRIQIIRALAICSVVVIHTVTWNPYEVYIRPFVNFGVGIFLFLSGFLTVKIDEIGSFYKKRCMRVLLPYIFWSFVLCLVYKNYGDFLKKLLTFQESSIYYYIFVYLQIMILAPILVHIAETRYYWSVLLVTPIAILVEMILAFQQIYLIYPWNINNCFVWISFFYLGMLMRQGKIKVTIPGWVLAIEWIAGIGLEVKEGKFWLAFGREDLATTQVKFSTMFVTLLVCIVVYEYMISENAYPYPGRKYLSQLLMDVGGSSFGIYLLHPLVIHLLEQRISLVFPLNTIVVILISYICIKLGQVIFRRKLGKYLGFY